jgi:DHA2 family multidrug resistance protein
MSAATSGSLAERAWIPSSNPWLIAIAVMLGTFMEVLDTSITNVAIPHIAGSMAITPDDATWVLTSYLISNAVVLTATGWFSRTFGRKRFLLTCIIVFALGSLFCGLAPNFPILIISLLIQGAGGGALQPSAQAILLESFPPEKRGQAMAMYTFGVIFAPVIGPTLGGWLTDSYSWRWVFYINIPVAICAFLMIEAFVEDPPYLRSSKKGKLDAVGFILLASWIAGLQIMLDKGQEVDWFGAVWMRWLAIFSIICFLAFVAWELTDGNPLVDLKVLANRNFFSATVMITLVGAVLYGTTALLPLYLQTVMNYPALQSGLAVSPRGLGSIIGILLAGQLINVIDNRFMMVTAVLALALSSFYLSGIDLEIAEFTVTIPIIINGFATSLLFIPLTTNAVGTLRSEQIGNATSIYNLMRNIGGAVGISICTTLLVRFSQQWQTTLVNRVTPTSAAFRSRLHTIQGVLQSHGPATTAHQQALGMIYNGVQQQASVLSYVDVFRFLGILCLLCLPLVLLIKPVKRAGKVAVH